MSERKFRIIEVEDIPKAKKRLRESIYDEVIEELMKKPDGKYKIVIEGKKLKSMYPALNKRIVERKLPLKLKVRSGELYVVKGKED